MEGQKISDNDFIMFQSLRISKKVMKLKDFDLVEKKNLKRRQEKSNY